MKTTFNNLLCLAVAILVTGCASLDERLASTDMTVRNEAFGELLSAEKLNVEIAERSVQTISDSNRLEKLATSAKNPTVRLAALSRVQNLTTIVSVAQDDADVELRTAAVGRINDQMVLKDIVLNGTKYDQRQLSVITKRNWEWAKKRYEADRRTVQIAALRHLTDSETLLLFATNAPSSEVRSIAISRLSDENKLAEIALQESDESIRKVVYSRISDPETISSLAKYEPSSKLAFSLLEKLPNKRAYNQLKKELEQSQSIISQSRMSEDQTFWHLDKAAEEIVKQLSTIDFTYLSPKINIVHNAELALVRKAVFEKLKAAPYVLRNNAELEIKRLLLANGRCYKDRKFKWFDHCQPMDSHSVVGMSSWAWPDNDIPNEVILWGMIAGDHDNQCLVVTSLIDRCHDRKLLSYLGKEGYRDWTTKVNSAWNVIPRYYDDNTVFVSDSSAIHYDGRWEFRDPWGHVPGLVAVKTDSDDYHGHKYLHGSISNHYVPIVKRRLAELDRQEAEARIAREVEAASKRKAAELASIRSETSQNSLERTARSGLDPELRIVAIERLKDQSVLADLAVNDENNTIRTAATARLTSKDTLVDILENDLDQSVRESAFRTILKRHPSAIDVSVITRLASDKKVSSKELARSVQSLEDSPEMRALVTNDLMDIAIRLAALSRISSQAFLDEVISDTNNKALCIAAVSRAKNPEVILEAANRTGENDDIAKAAIDRLQALGQWELLSTQSTMASVRQNAVTHVSDPALLGKIATRDSAVEVRLVAIKRVSDPVLLKQLAEGDNDLRIALAALDKMADESILEAIALNSIHPKVRILSASKIHDSEMKTRVQDALGSTILTMNAEYSQQLSSLQKRFESLKRTAKTKEDLDAASNREHQQILNNPGYGKGFCQRWEKVFRENLSSSRAIERELNNLDILNLPEFSDVFASRQQLLKEVSDFANTQNSIIREINDLEKTCDNFIKMMGVDPSWL